MKSILASLAVLGLLVGAAQAQENKTMAVSIPTADHGWTGGVVFHAMEEAQGAREEISGPEGDREDLAGPGAPRPNALEDLTTQGIDALVVLPHDPERADRPDPQGEGQGRRSSRVVDRIARDRSIYDLYVGGDNPGLGRVAAAFFKEKLPARATSSSSAACRSRSTRCASTPSTTASRAPRSR